MPESTTAVILNAASGAGPAEELRRRLDGIFAAAGRPVRITLARNGAELARAIAAAVASDAATIVAGGGDGTVSAVAGALAGTPRRLGVFPLGTLNHFAKDLNIPLDLEAAAGVVLAGRTTRVDVGQVNGRTFINNSSLGLYPRIVRLRRERGAHGVAKWLVGAWATLTMMERNPRLTVRIELEGERLEYRTPIVFVGNNPYRMSGLEAGTRDSLTGGRLAIYVVKTGGRARLMRLAWRLFTGRAHRTSELDLLLACEAAIEIAEPETAVALDGEIITLTAPLAYRSVPGSLTVLTPAPETA